MKKNKPLSLDHVAVTVSSIEESCTWYRESLGADVIHCDKTWGMVDINGAKIALIKGDIHPPHMAFQVKNISDFPCIPEDIRQHRDGSLYYYDKDPDSNVIEWIMWPREL